MVINIYHLDVDQITPESESIELKKRFLIRNIREEMKSINEYRYIFEKNVSPFKKEFNTVFYFSKYPGEPPSHSTLKVYSRLRFKQRMMLSKWFNNWLIMEKEFWMWLTNVIVATGATIAGFMVAFSN